MLRVIKMLKKFNMVSPLWWKWFDIFVVALQNHFDYDWSLKVMILAQNWPKTAKFSWHCSFNHPIYDCLFEKIQTMNLAYFSYIYNTRHNNTETPDPLTSAWCHDVAAKLHRNKNCISCLSFKSPVYEHTMALVCYFSVS